MSDRLDEFRRQRGLLREHLAWLDREIAALEGGAPPQDAPAPPRAAPPLQGAPPPLSDRALAAYADAEAILAEYRKPPVSIQKQAKRGCLIYFAVFLAAMALFVAAVYVLVKRAHGQ